MIKLRLTNPEIDLLLKMIDSWKHSPNNKTNILLSKMESNLLAECYTKR